MTDVTIDNFEEIFPLIKKCLKNATFIAVDNEMSGLMSDKWSSQSLFDTPDDRYNQLKRNIEPFIIMQMGLTTFRHEREKNKFVADSFNFYLMPRSIPTINRQLLWQSSAIEFLSQHGFDFNKFAYKSLSYLNELEENMLKDQVYKGTFLKSTADYIPVEIAGDVEQKLNLVHDWLSSDPDFGNTFKVDTSTALVKYLLHKEIRSRFKTVWTTVADNQIIVRKYVPEELEQLKKEEGDHLIDDVLMNYYIGFSKVFKLLASSAKPIVGHNIFTDLMFMYKQFYQPLPDSYLKFKKHIHKMFPIIFDTKNISFNLGTIIRKQDRWKRNGLNDLYIYFREEQGKNLSLHSPQIEKNQAYQFQVNINGIMKIHDAAWDSYYAGFVFIKLAHVFAVKKFGSGTELKTLTCSEIMAGIKEFENCVNIIRALVSHVNFGGPDPASVRPYWLYATLKSNNIENIIEIAEMLSSFGSVDVKPISSRCAVIAVGNHNTARDILRYYKTNEDLQIRTYNPLFHSNTGKLCGASICLASLLVLSHVIWKHYN